MYVLPSNILITRNINHIWEYCVALKSWSLETNLGSQNNYGRSIRAKMHNHGLNGYNVAHIRGSILIDILFKQCNDMVKVGQIMRQCTYESQPILRGGQYQYNLQGIINVNMVVIRSRWKDSIDQKGQLTRVIERIPIELLTFFNCNIA